MPETLVNVTKTHMQGDSTSVWSSPICKALAASGFPNPSVIGDAFVDGIHGKRVRLKLPTKVNEAVMQMQDHDVVAPFSFKLGYPDTVELGPRVDMTETEQEDEDITF
jgi:hypothetical protein